MCQCLPQWCSFGDQIIYLLLYTHIFCNIMCIEMQAYQLLCVDNFSVFQDVIPLLLTGGMLLCHNCLSKVTFSVIDVLKKGEILDTA